MPVWLRYVLATAIILLFFLLRSMAGSLMDNYPFLLFFPAIVFVSVMFDRGTGVYAVSLSAVLSWYFFLPIRHSFRLERPEAILPVALYVVVALFIAMIVEALRTSAEGLRAAKAELEKAAELNRLLLMDVNHRVKNHLASASGLLRLTLREPTSPDPRSVIEEAARRIDILAQVYNRLHLGERTTVVSGRDFITGLCEDLRASVVGRRPIELEATADDTDLGSNQAVPIGLIINELIENALKYAFPDDRPGRITVCFDCAGTRCVLTVSDDGVGYDPATARKGGGARLIRALAQQLGAAIETGGSPGALVRLTFDLAPDATPA
jgi:two-component sensor histidine kinase